ncbi:enoyl-CoA hydratase [Azorhizobium caulinodans ORS 571]|uniref:Enoyl-CoA hydratase n=1 Tax=Azorhizobium caulinodans (strain ATCC 43989 / DSM 5975 / JCM 20966 / LMG 6465 / NBRC 14845 / NCIMB 13405 / ORS 571) TaxID=438753 RepID=A8I536_AZOC5|nr:enoyl-CoA hydratase [Azorhizobium caulinodans]BAF87806.1 enoyl-CoA hydratase [Azorhizobium caulinodans ORS 571]
MTSTPPLSLDAGTTRLAIGDGIATLTFDRPAARNAMTWRMYEELYAACREILARTDEIKVAVLRGAGGKAFVAGTDIEQFRDFSGQDGVAYEARVETYVSALEALPMPTLAVVEGWAVGGGFILANSCDLRIATPGSRFGAPIARTLGNGLSAGNLRRLTSTLGVGLVKRMLMLAEMPAVETLPPGYAEIVPPEALEARLVEVCTQLKGHAPLTMQTAKEALRRLATELQPSDSDLIRKVYGSADFKEGIASFLEKRRPDWRGR